MSKILPLKQYPLTGPNELVPGVVVRYESQSYARDGDGQIEG